MAIMTGPGLDLPIESSGDGAGALCIGHDMVAPSAVGTINRLHQGELSVCGRMHFN